MNNSKSILPSQQSNDRPATWLLAGFLWLVIWGVFAYPWLSGHFTIPWDGKAHFAPQVQFLAASIARSEWPWWTPHVFAGHPQIADPQAMLFAPPFVLLALLDSAPGPWAIDTVVFLMLLLAGFGVLAFARDLGWHWAAGLVAAICFALGAAMAWRLQHFGQVMSLAYLPIVLLLLRRAILRKGIFYGALAGLIAAFIVLGRDQVALLCIYLLAAYALALLLDTREFWQRLSGAILPLTAGALTAASLVTLPILFTIALAEQSNRPAISYLDAAAGSLHPALLITAFAPHLFGAAGEMRDYWGPPSFYWEDTGLYIAQNMGVVYVGLIPLLLLLIGVLKGLLWHRDIRFFTIAWVLTLIYALGWYTPVFQWSHAILPGVAYYRRPADAVFLLGGLTALLSGYVAHRLFATAERSFPISRPTITWCALIVLALAALAIGFAISLDRWSAAKLPVLLALVFMAAAAGILLTSFWLAPIRPILAGVLLTAGLATDIIINNGPNGASALPLRTLDMLEPDARNALVSALKQRVARNSDPANMPRIEMVGLGYHWPNTALTHNLHSTLGANPVRLDTYVRATGAGDTAAEGSQRAFPPLFPSYRSTLANLLGLRFIVTRDPIEKVDPNAKAADFPMVDQVGRFRIYENQGALPRVLFATQSRQVDFDHLVRTGEWPQSVNLRSTVLLESAASSNATPRNPGTAAISSYQNTIVTVDVASPGGGWVVLNDVWHPWWYGEINNKEVTIAKANGIFRAIKVPAGRHTVRFVFRPLKGLWEQLTRSRSLQPSNIQDK